MTDRAAISFNIAVGGVVVFGTDMAADISAGQFRECLEELAERAIERLGLKDTPPVAISAAALAQAAVASLDNAFLKGGG